MRGSVSVVALIVVGLAGAGCSDITAQMKGETVTNAAVVETARPVLMTRQWGVVDGMLSVVVQNTTDRTLRSAEGVITARDENDQLVATSIEGPGGACCSVVDLPPGQQFGFYVDVGDSASEIDRVDVAYRNVAWVPSDEVADSPLAVHPVSLESDALGAVVVANVRSDVPMVDEASVQAFLNGADGGFLAVVSGRWDCFSEGNHEIRMQLLHPIPAGTTIDHVLIHPVTHDPDRPASSCAGPAETDGRTS
jgi:hypothetical protein